RGGGCAEVGDEVRDSEVGLVADGGDDGNLGCSDGAGERLVIEAGEIFDGAAAASENDDVDERGVGIEVADSGGDRGAAVGALHGRWVDKQVETGVAAAGDGDDV